MEQNHLRNGIVMQDKHGRQAYFARRPKVWLVCPVCWASQRAQRNHCKHCLAPFTFGQQADAPPAQTNKKREA